MRVISGTVPPTPTIWLPILSNIAPPDLRRSRATAQLINRWFSQKDSLLYDELSTISDQRLISRSFIWEEIPDLLKFNISDKWRERWNDVSPFNYHLCIGPALKPEGFDLQREPWKSGG